MKRSIPLSNAWTPSESEILFFPKKHGAFVLECSQGSLWTVDPLAAIIEIAGILSR